MNKYQTFSHRFAGKVFFLMAFSLLAFCQKASADTPPSSGKNKITPAKKENSSTLNFAPDPNKCYKIINKSSGKCKDVSGASTSDGASIIQWDYHNGPNQIWKFEKDSDDFYTMICTHSGKALEIKDFSYSDGAFAIQKAKSGLSNQKFKFQYASLGLYYIVAKHSGKSLKLEFDPGSNGTKVIQKFISILFNDSKWSFVEVTCPATPACTSPVELVSWSLDACNATNSTNSSSYDEFQPVYPSNGNCSNVSATKVFRTSGSHSCTPGVNNTPAMCVGALQSCSWVSNSSSAIRFEVTISPAAGEKGTLSGLKFFERAPQQYSWIGGSSGTNNYPTKFGIRVTKNGQEIYKKIDIATNRNWTLKEFDFATIADFTVSQTTTFKFELLPYCKVGNSSSVYAWDIDEVKILGCCSAPPVCSLNSSVSNIQCNNNGTPSIVSDDTYTFTLTVNGTNASSGWKTTINGASVTGTYGTPKNLGPYPISGGALNFIISDNNNSNCKVNQTVNPPAPCSTTPATANIGDFVWNDLNKNGVQDSGEPGIANVNVKLYKCDGTFVTQTTTNSNGIYAFTNVAANMQYFVEFTPGSLPAGFQLTVQDAGADNIDSDANPNTGRTNCFFLAPGETNNSVDAGAFQPTPQTGSIGDFVWNDLNKNGIQDANEPGVQGVTVRLKNCNNVVLQVKTTGPNGFYLFDGLSAGCYRIGVDLPFEGFNQFSPQDQGDDTKDSDINPSTGMTNDIVLGVGQNNLTVDAGIYQQVATSGKIGDFVWLDTNGNGLQDAGEPGIPNIFVLLYTCNDTYINYAITDGNGMYMFNNVPAGNYKVKFASPGTFNGVPVQFTLKDVNNNTQDNVDSDADWLGITDCFTLAQGETKLTIDAGLTGETPPQVCVIIGNASNIVCNNNGTPGNPGDDTYTFTLVVNGTNTGDWGFDIPALNLYMLGYGQPITLGPFPISGGNLTLSLFDHDVTGCGTTITVTPPQPCSNSTTPLLSLSCPASVSATAASGQNGAFVNYPAATAFSTCTTGLVNISYNMPSGSFFPVGTTTVHVTATDGCGNSKSCSFTVTVSAGGTVGCNINFTSGPGSITITGLNAPVVLVKVFNANWQSVYECNSNCPNPTTISNLSPGSYYVDVQLFSATWQPLCNKAGYVTVSSQLRGPGEGEINAVAPATNKNTERNLTGNNVVLSDNKEVLNDLVLFPNPATGSVTVKWQPTDAGQRATLLVFNQLGQQIEMFKMEDASVGRFDINLDDYRAGQYLVSLKLENAAPVIRKLIVNK